MRHYVQEFTDPETGEIDWVTFEPVDLWTEAGWEVIPAGFRFSLQNIPAPARRLIRDDEFPLFILREWRRAAGKQPSGATVGALRRELIKCSRKRQNATAGHFWRFLKDRARVEVICFMVRLFGMLQRWYIFKR